MQRNAITTNPDHSLHHVGISHHDSDDGSDKSDGDCCHGHDHHEPHKSEYFWQSRKFKAFLGLVWGAGLLVLSLLSLNIPAAVYFGIMSATSLATLFLGADVYKSAIKSLRHKKLGMSVLYTISTLSILAVSIASMFIPGLPMMCEAAPLVLGFWHLGEEIESSFNKSLQSNLNMTDKAPKYVQLYHSGKNILSKKVKPADEIIIAAGNVIPVDGVLLKDAVLYTSSDNGSPFPKTVKKGEKVKAGARVAVGTDGAVLRASKDFNNSRLAVIDKHIKNAIKSSNEKAPVEKMTDKILKYFVPGLLGVALLSGIVVGVLVNPAIAIQCALSVLVSACPCTLNLITPIAVKIGMSKASNKGIFFKNGKALQAAADIDTVVFDLNGTLTLGEPKARWNPKSDKSIMRYVRALEKRSTHPVARAIVDSMSLESKSEKPINLSEVKKFRYGIKATINGEDIIIGNKNMLRKNGITKIDKPFANPEKGEIYIVKGNKVLGQIAIEDPLRHNAKETIDALRKMGKEVYVCTGADKDAAKKYIKKLGVPEKNLIANCSGIESNGLSKPKFIEYLQEKRGKKVAMIGDAGNDAVAMAKSNFGIAIKSAISDDITSKNAGAIVPNSIFSVATAFDIANKSKRTIYQNLTASLSYNSTVVLIAAGLLSTIGFVLNPGLGVALMILETSLILGNTYRFKQGEVLSSKVSNDSGSRQNTTLNISKKLRIPTQDMRKACTNEIVPKQENREPLVSQVIPPPSPKHSCCHH